MHWRVTLLILLVVKYCFVYSQEIILADAPVKPEKVNNKIANALQTNDINLFFSLLDMDKRLVNSSVKEVELFGNYGLTYKKPQSILHYLVRSVLDKTTEPTVVEKFLSYNPDLAIEFDKKNAFYFLLDFIATHPTKEVGEAEKMLKMISNQPEFNINKPYSDFLPPLPYLLRTNHEFLNGKYSEAYVSEELVIFFIDKGANVNTYDQSENNLATFSVQGHSKVLMPYLQKRGGNFNNKNISGKDAFYFAVQSNNAGAVKSIVDNGYKLTLKKLNDLKILEVLNKSNKELLTYLTQELFKEIKSYEDIEWFINLFNESKNKILETDLYLAIGIPDTKTPHFISLYENDNKRIEPESQKKILNLKVRYLNNVSSVNDLFARLKQFSLFNLKSFTPDFYSSDEKVGFLLTEIEQQKESLLYTTTKIILSKNINQQRAIAQKLFVDYDFWAFTNPRDYIKFSKVTFTLPPGSDFINLVAEIEKYLLSLNRERLSLIGIETFKNIEKIYGIGIKGNKGVVCFRWYREGKMADDDFLAINTGFSAFNEKITNYLQGWECSLINADYLGSMAYDEERKRRREQYKIEQCENCVIDEKKSELPRYVEKFHLFVGNYVDREYGVITMKNGSKYRWDIKGDKYVYYEEGFLGDKEEFSSFEKMYARLIEKCRVSYCNQ